jgi:cold shock CspA family protein
MTEAITETMARLTGQVKWFNTKAGYGFITVCGDNTEMKGKDIFVHFSSIKVLNSQYRYLVQGEYVEFNLVKTTNENHEYHADDISGIKRGYLMCELRELKNKPLNDLNDYDNKPFKRVISKRMRRENETSQVKKNKNTKVS